METDAERLQAIERREKAATPGPWTCIYPSGDQSVDEWWVGFQRSATGGREHWTKDSLAMDEVDAEFIAAAREDVPYLLDRLRAVESQRDQALAENERLRQMLLHADKLIRRSVVVEGERNA